MIVKKSVLLLLAASVLCGCSLIESLRYGAVPTQHDYKHFAQRTVSNAEPVFHFTAPTKSYNLGETIGLTDKDLNSTNVALKDFVRLHKTISFLIIRNDTILYQYYDKKYSDTSLVSSFSTIKPFISTLIGIAIEEGKIRSVEDYLIDYLPEFSGKAGFDNIKIRHLLHHTSGIKFTSSPFNLVSDNAKFYWGDDLRELLHEAVIEECPDEKFRYSSENTLLLGYLLEKVTGGTISHYLQEKLWKPLGMEAPGSWSLDHAGDQGLEKAFCCFQARTIDFAKFARLYLHNGEWEGKQIVSPSWIKYSTRPDPAGNNKHFYNNNWGIGPIKYGSYFAVGLYGQFLYVYPEKNILIVRFGDHDMNYHPNYWTNSFLQIIDQLE